MCGNSVSLVLLPGEGPFPNICFETFVENSVARAVRVNDGSSTLLLSFLCQFYAVCTILTVQAKLKLILVLHSAFFYYA